MPEFTVKVKRGVMTHPEKAIGAPQTDRMAIKCIKYRHD
jgi:hypothetical protein